MGETKGFPIGVQSFSSKRQGAPFFIECQQSNKKKKGVEENKPSGGAWDNNISTYLRGKEEENLPRDRNTP